MPHVLGIFKVKDFEQWKSGFTAEQSIAWRKRDGGGTYRIFRPDNDPNTAIVLIEWDNLDNAHRHAASPELSKIHRDALLAPPQVYYLEQVEARNM